MEIMNNKNIDQLKSHVRADDYFGTLASILYLLRQEYKNQEFIDKYGEIMDEIIEELIYLQENFTIS